MKNDLGIYVHIPFCAKKCHYCDFTSQIGDETLYRAYAEALKTELLSYEPIWSDRPITTLYIGGGTPSLFPTVLLRDMLGPVLLKLDQGAEFTIEVNPESVHYENAEKWQALGINRISMGVQSTDPGLLAKLGRLHARERIFTSYQILSTYFDNINIDLMYGLGAEDETYLHSLDEIIDLKPRHLSTYALEVYAHLPIAHKMKTADEETSFEQFHHIRRRLQSEGYARYEVSNFAQPGFASRHNLRYWKRQDTLGIGLSAHGLIGNRRTANTELLAQYLQDPLQIGHEILTEDEQAFETWMLGLRTAEGVDIDDFIKRFPHYPVQHAITKHLKQGNLIWQSSCICPSTQGFDLLDHVILDFMK